VRCPRLCQCRFLAISCAKLTKVPIEAFFDLLKATLHLGRREITVAVVDGLELAAVNGHDGLGE